jgi:hypothetical protein
LICKLLIANGLCLYLFIWALCPVDVNVNSRWIFLLLSILVVWLNFYATGLLAFGAGFVGSELDRLMGYHRIVDFWVRLKWVFSLVRRDDVSWVIGKEQATATTGQELAGEVCSFPP